MKLVFLTDGTPREIKLGKRSIKLEKTIPKNLDIEKLESLYPAKEILIRLDQPKSVSATVYLNWLLKDILQKNLVVFQNERCVSCTFCKK